MRAWLLRLVLGIEETKSTGFEMNMNTNIRDGLKHRSLIGCILLALLATAISLSLSVLTGWQLGVSFKEKLAMAAFGVLAVLGAHLLLAICQFASIRVGLVATVLWLFCIVYVAYSHATFFLSSQQQAGMRRAATVDGSLLSSQPKRNLAVILSDQERVKTALAAKSQIECGEGCSRLKIQVTSLKARLDTLNAEADEVRRWQARQDRQEALKDAMRDDPVTAQLARWLGVTVAQMGLVTSFLFSLILEGVACLCWYIAFRFRDSIVTQIVMEPVTAPAEEMKAGSSDTSGAISEQDSMVDELVREVKAGRLRLTVHAVRDYCRCAQKKAAELKRLAEKRLNAEALAC
jgi:hypothetical protein